MRRSALWQSCIRLAAVVASLCATVSGAQQTQTLHVYTDRVQLPVLVLGPHLEELPQLPVDRFQVTVDGVQALRPEIRLQGDDPLDIALLLDGSDGQNALLPGLPDAIGALIPQSIHPDDHIAVYGMDGCKLRRFRRLGNADAAELSAAVRSAGLFPPWPASADAPQCKDRTTLWDAVFYVTKSMSGLSRRRVLLVVTNGADAFDPAKNGQLRFTGSETGVTIFAIAERGKVPHPSSSEATIDGKSLPPHLVEIAEQSGGLVQEVRPQESSAALERVFRLIRHRYILEFPRPVGFSGTHGISVTIRQMNAFVRPAGVSFPALFQPRQALNLEEELQPLALPPLPVTPTEQQKLPSPEKTDEAQPRQGTPGSVPAPSSPAVEP